MYNRIKATREGDKVVTLSRILLLMHKYDEENSACLLSHPVRGAWIEISSSIALTSAAVSVAPRQLYANRNKPFVTHGQV